MPDAQESFPVISNYLREKAREAGWDRIDVKVVEVLSEELEVKITVVEPSEEKGGFLL